MQHRGDKPSARDGVYDSIAALPDSVPVGAAGELFASHRPRVDGQALDAREDALPLAFGGQCFDLPRRRGFEDDPILVHAA